MKYLPVFLLIGGAVLISLVGFVIFNLRSKAPELTKKDEPVKELSLEDRPFVTLVPNASGNELAFNLTRIPGSISVVEYELVYNTLANVKQGVPGSVDVEGRATLERKLTLGTCSSGVCRYDKGVRDIQLTLKFRDSKGKLVVKTPAISANLLNNTQKLTSGEFSFNLDKKTKDYYVVMETYGLPGKVSATITAGPYGVFTSGNSKQSGTVSLTGATIQQFISSSWESVSNGKAKTLGTFITVQ